MAQRKATKRMTQMGILQNCSIARTLLTRIHGQIARNCLRYSKHGHCVTHAATISHKSLRRSLVQHAHAKYRCSMQKVNCSNVAHKLQHMSHENIYNEKTHSTPVEDSRTNDARWNDHSCMFPRMHSQFPRVAPLEKVML